MPTALRTLAIVPQESLRRELEAALAKVPGLTLCRILPAYPDLEELLRSVRLNKIDFLILSVDRLGEIEPMLAAFGDHMPWMPLVGIAEKLDETLAHRLMRLGVRECLEHPVTPERLTEVGGFIQAQLHKHPSPAAAQAQLYSFFPAKPGVGSSTIVLSVSCALTDEFKIPTLLLDCDFSAGIVNFHLKLGSTASVLDALNHAGSLDEDTWRQMVGKRGRLEVLHAGNLVNAGPVDPASIEAFLSIARPQYQVICADLPSQIDSFAIQMMRESQRVFLVTTPELPSVHLASQRIKAFRDLGLAEHTSLVINRKDSLPGRLTTAMVEDAVGMPVAYTIGNDYQACSRAVLDGSSVPASSEIGKGILNLAQVLSSGADPHAKPHGASRKFLEFFHIDHSPEPASIWRD